MRTLMLVIALGACFHAKAHAQNTHFNFTLINTQISVTTQPGLSDRLQGTITFSVEATDQDGWFWLRSGRDPTLETGLIWSLRNSIGIESPGEATSTLTHIDGGRIVGDAFGLQEGETGVLRLSVITVPNASGFYFIKADSLIVASDLPNLIAHQTNVLSLTQDFKTDFQFVQTVPEPSSLLGVGVITALATRRRKR